MFGKELLLYRPWASGRKAGFTHFRRAAETPFNLIFEVRR